MKNQNQIEKKNNAGPRIAQAKAVPRRRVGIRVSAALKAALGRAVKQPNLTISQLVELAVREAIAGDRTFQLEKLAKSALRNDSLKEKLAFIVAHGTKVDLRKVDLVLNLMVRVRRAPSGMRSAFRTFVAAAKSRPFTEAFAELTARYRSFSEDRAVLKMIADAVIRRQRAA